jgi:hypothetical protein
MQTNGSKKTGVTAGQFARNLLPLDVSRPDRRGSAVEWSRRSVPLCLAMGRLPKAGTGSGCPRAPRHAGSHGHSQHWAQSERRKLNKDCLLVWLS